MKKLNQLFLIVILILGITANTFAQCSISIGSTTFGSAGIIPSSLTLSHTVASGSNRMLVVRASTNDADPTSVTYNGINLTKKASQHNTDQYCSIWFLLAPPTGTYNLVVNGASGFTPIVGVTNFTGVNQTTAFGTAVGNNFNGSAPSVNVSSASGEVVIDVVNENSYVLSAGSGQTQQYNVHEFVYYGSGSSKSGASSVTMTWSGFSPSGCILAIPIKPCANLTASAGSAQTICKGASVSIGGNPTASGGTSPYTYAWTPSSGLSSTTVANPTASPTTTTTYTVTVTDNASATATSSVTITVNPTPTASAGTNKTICNGSSVSIGGSPTASGGTSPYTYAWSPSTALSSNTVANPTANPTASITYTVTVTDSKGCVSSTSTVSVTVNPTPTANAGNNKTICNGSSTTIGDGPTASGGTSPYTYAWSPSAGLNSSTIANPTASPNSTTTYTVTVTDSKGCVSFTSTVSVTVNSNPVANAGSNKTICNGNTTTIGDGPTASGGTSPYTYAWSPSAGLNSTTIANPTATPTATTTYTVTVTDSKGCVSSTSAVSVTVNPLPVADAGGHQTIFAGESATIGGNPTASGGTSPYTFAWSPATALNSTTAANPVASPTVTTTYTVTVTDAGGCTGTSMVTVTVNDPNANCGLMLGSTTSGFTSNTTVNSYTISHTVPSGGNRLLLVRAATLNGDPTGVTYNGTSLTKLTSAHDPGSSDFVSIFYLVNPPVGTYNVVLTGTSGTGFTPEVGVTNFTGADQTNPFGTPVSNTFNSAGSSSVTVSSATSEIVIDVIKTFSEFTKGSGQTTDFKLHGFVSWGAGSDKAGASSVTMSWSGFTTKGAHIAVAVKSASSLAASAGSNKTICSGSSTTLGDSPTASGGASPYTYLWNPATALSSSTVANPTASPTTTTSYTVRVTDAGGCAKTSSVTVTVNSNPVANAGADQTIISGQSVQIGSSPVAGITYSWSPSAGLSNVNIANPTANPTVNTTYNLTATDANSCTAADAVTITVNAESKEDPEERARHEFEITQDPALGYPPTERMGEIRDIIDSATVSTALPCLTWDERGPNNVGGRTRAIMFDPNDPTHKKVWAGGVAGGVWHCDDITAPDTAITWTKVNDFWDNIAISSIAYDPISPNIYYVGTGEGWMNYDALKGAGIWQSLDSGKTWNQLASTNTSAFFFIQKIIVTPDSGYVYASTRTADGYSATGGVYVSKNKGSSWTRVLGNGDGSVSADFAADLEIGADKTIYATFSGDGIYRKEVSGSWTKLNTGINGFPVDSIGRIEIATAPSNANRLYAMVSDNRVSSFGQKLLNIYTSTNKGNSWDKCTYPPSCIFGIFPIYAQAWYNMIIGVDPNNDTALFVGMVRMTKSIDGGKSWIPLCPTDYFIHADHHGMLFEPGSSNVVLFSNDGGIYYTTNASDSAVTFMNKNRGYNITQFFGCAIDPTAGKNYFLAGAQDNGTQRFNSAGINSTYQVGEFDGGYCFIDQADTNYQVLTSNEWYLNSSNAGGIFSSLYTLPGQAFINPADYDSQSGALYAAYPQLNKLLRISSIRSVPKDTVLTVSGMQANIKHLRVSPYSVSGNTTLFLGTKDTADNPKVYKVTNAQGTSPVATDISTSVSFPNGGNISCIEIGADTNDLLVTFSNYGVPSVWRTTNGGVTWKNVEGNLSQFDMPVRWAMYNPNNRKEVLLATEAGLWSTSDITASSVLWGFDPSSQIARTRVDMLRTRSSDNEVIAATHGRGLWSSCIFRHPIAKFSVLPCLQAVFTDSSTLNSTSWLWDFGDGTTSALQNPPHNYSQPGTYLVTFTASNSCGCSTIQKEIQIASNCCALAVSYDDAIMPSQIVADTTWSSLRRINKVIKVNAPHILTIDSATIEFGPFGKIIVENGTTTAGAQLVLINGAKLTSITNSDTSCKTMWPGVEVWGNSNKNTSNAINLGQGKITMSGTSSIENAHVGVLLGKSQVCIIHPVVPCPNPPACQVQACVGVAGGGPYDMLRSGGIIIANTAAFRNNGTAVQFTQYGQWLSASIMQNCLFEGGNLLDSGYVAGHSYTYPNAFFRHYGPPTPTGLAPRLVYLWGVRRVNFTDNTFEKADKGIQLFNANCKVIKSGPGNTFKNIETAAIYERYYNSSSILFGSQVTDNTFVNDTSLQYGTTPAAIYIEGGKGDQIKNNIFGDNVNPTPPPQEKNYYGIRILNSSGYYILDNIFVRNFHSIVLTTSPLAAEPVNIPPTLASRISSFTAGTGNTFTRSRRALIVSGDNKAVTVHCNTTNNTNDTDYVANVDFNWELKASGELGKQGSKSGTYVTLPAGNRFDHLSFGNPKREVTGAKGSLQYYAHQNPTEYKPFDPTLNLKPSIDTTSIACPDFNSCCPGDACPPCSTNCACRVAHISDAETLIVSLQGEYDTVQSHLDNGQTSNLISAVNQPISQQSLKDTLLHNSPLSDTVLIAFINREWVTNDTVFGNVIITNSPVSSHVLPSLSTRLEFVDLTIAEQIRVAQASSDVRTLTAVGRDIGAAKIEKGIHLNALIAYYAENDSASKAIERLQAEQTTDADQILLTTYIADTNFAAAQQQLSGMAAANADEQAYLDLQGMLLDLAQSGRTVFEMDSTQIALVRNISSASGYPLAASNACAILELALGETCTLPANSERKQTTTTNTPLPVPVKEGQPVAALGNNIPNPFNNTTLIPYSLPENMEKAHINIYDVTGKLLRSYEISNTKSSLLISADEFGNGIYFYKLETKDQVLGSKKMVIIK